MQTEIDSWISVVHGLRGVPQPTVNLLAPEPSTRNSKTLPFRTTTYTEKYVDCTPFQKGILYTQDSNEHNLDNICDDIPDLSLPQLYTIGYRSFIAQQKVSDELAISLLPAPPDFDGSSPTNPEAVAQYVRGLATVYNSVRSTATPFQLYQFVIGRLANSFTASSCSEDSSDGRPNSPASDEPLNTEESFFLEERLDDGLMTISLRPEEDSDVLAVSLALSDVKTLNHISVHLVHKKLESVPRISLAIAAGVVEAAIHSCKELLADENRHMELKNEIFALVGYMVSRRGHVAEVLEFLDIVEQFGASSKDIVPTILPHAQEILNAFSFNMTHLYPFTSPIDCYQEEPVMMNMALLEGTNVLCFCVSANRKLLATASIDDVTVFDISSGDIRVHTSFRKAGDSCWCITFTEDSQKIICTDASGLQHTVFSLESGALTEVATSAVTIPTNYINDQLVSHELPFMPYGSRKSLYLHRENDTTIQVEGVMHTSIEYFTIFSHIGHDFSGELVCFDTENDAISISLSKDVVTLKQGEATCYGVISRRPPWIFLQVKWVKGMWSLLVNSAVISLNGQRDGTSKTVKLGAASCLKAVGHVSSLAVCSGSHDTTAAQVYMNEKRLDKSVMPILNFPLDEGGGIWVKETVASRCHSLSETVCVWDETITVPHVMAPKSSTVQLGPRMALESKVLRSAFKSYFIFPSAFKGGDDTIAEVERESNTIVRVYNRPRSHSDNLFALLPDESEMIVYQPRFSTFSSVRLCTRRSKENELALCGLRDSASPVGSIDWVLHEIYKKVYLESFQLQRIPHESMPLSIGNLKVLASMLRLAKPHPNKLKVIALISLTLVHFRRFMLVDEVKVLQVALSLKESCQQIMDLFPEKIIRDAAAELLRAATLRSLTLGDQARVLLHVDSADNAQLLRSCVSKESLFAAVKCVAAECPKNVVIVARKLVDCCQEEETSTTTTDRPIARLMLWFTVSAVRILSSFKNYDELSELLKLFVDYLKRSVDSNRIALVPQQTVLTSGVLPLLCIIANHCPYVVTEEIEARLLTILGQLRRTHKTQLENISFTTREACEVYPSSRDPKKAWRLFLDFTHASKVSISKEASTPEFTIRTAGPDVTRSNTATITNKNPFAKFYEGQLIVFGEGETTFTAVAEYNMEVNSSWGSLMGDAIQCLLLSYATKLAEKPKVGDVFLAPLFRHGLCSRTLQKHGITHPGRESISTFALEVLHNEQEGKDYVDQVCQSMRACILPSMRPALQALLAILIHSGATPQQAEDELKLRWFSGEWGSKLQGAGSDRARQILVELAEWITSSVYYQPDAPSSLLICSRRMSTERRYEDSFSNSRSISERRGSTSSRRSTMKANLHSDTIDQVRALFSKEITADELEQILVGRTHAAMRQAHGLRILSSLLSLDSGEEVKGATATAVTEVLWHIFTVDTGVHYVENLIGAGVDMEMKVRTAFHALLEKCASSLLERFPKDIPPPEVLTRKSQNGKATMMLLSVLCHPWDAIDCEMFSHNFGTENDILRHIEDQMSIPTSSLNLTSHWGVRKVGDPPISYEEESCVRSKFMGVADVNSLSRIYPNDFSVVVPQLQLSRSEEGVAIEKNSSSALRLRADEGWSLLWKDGVPRVFYYEVKINSKIGKLSVGLESPDYDIPFKPRELSYFYNNSGDTHCVSYPPYGDGDTVGCGVIATTGRIFYTLNGLFLSYADPLAELPTTLFPILQLDETPNVKLLVNFGTTAFCYDFRQLHPTLTLASGPTWYRVSSTAAIALHYMVARVCSVPDPRKSDVQRFLSHSCEAVCRHVNKVASSLMHLSVSDSNKCDSNTRIKQSVILSVTEYSIVVLIATLRHVVRGGGGVASAHPNLSEIVCEMVFDAVSVLMLLPLHYIQISTISLLPEVIPHVKRVHDSVALTNLVDTLFNNANAKKTSDDLILFYPSWCECDSRCMSITNVQLAHMLPDSQRSIVLGSILPRTGCVSFTVSISRRGMSRGHSLKGGYFIGVSIAGLTPLSPTSNSHSWKAVKPPIVWAIHDTSPQLPHATNPTLKTNNFQRTFGNGDPIRVVVDRDKQKIDFYRSDEFLNTLFTDIPSNVDLVPFAQLYNDDAAVLIGPGEMTAPITAPKLLSAVSVDVLRSMLTLEPFQYLVAKRVCDELSTKRYPKVSLALFSSVPDPRVLQLRNNTSSDSFITVSRLGDMRCKFSIGDEANYEHIYHLRTPATPRIVCSFDIRPTISSLDGLSSCVEKLVMALGKMVIPLITTHAIAFVEIQERRKLIEEEKEHWDFIFCGLRVGYFFSLQQLTQTHTWHQAPVVYPDYSFSAPLSNPGFYFPRQYCGQLGSVPSGTPNATTPFIAIAEPCIPSSGIVNLRCQLVRGHSGQILGGGYYFGVCSPSFNWTRRDLNSVSPEVWAIHDMDDTTWRLRHMWPNARFPVTAEPNCLIVSGDIIRLSIDREERVMYAFRKPRSGDEIPLGKIFGNLPSGPLYPFVHLYNSDAVVVLLPSDPQEPATRIPISQPHLALSTTKEHRTCDACPSYSTDPKAQDRWFKCNECANYNLCWNCFHMCMHSNHTFTEINNRALVHSNLPPRRLRPGMEVVIPASNCMYLRSSGCKMEEEHINCVAVSKVDYAFAIWGLVCSGGGSFTVTVDTVDGEPLSLDHPMFVGVGKAEEVLHLTSEKLRSKCFSSSSSSLLAYCNDRKIRHKLDDESCSPYGFSKGCTITIDVDTITRAVAIFRDWVPVGSKVIPSGGNDSKSQSPMYICCFVMFGKRNTRAQVAPEGGITMPAVVERVDGNIISVITENRLSRCVTAENCRLPLQPLTGSPPAQPRLGYTFVDRQLVQCRGVMKSDQLTIFLPSDGEHRIIPLNDFLIDSSEELEEEPLQPTLAGSHGATVKEGYVISRLLLILSCLCESETLSSLVMMYRGELMTIIKGLSSVQLGNESPLDFIGEIRSSIALTAQCAKPTSQQRNLCDLVPMLGSSERKRKCQTGVLVRTLDKNVNTALYRVLSRSGAVVTLEDVKTGAQLSTSYRDCIPVKQYCGEPWYTQEDGLPCSLVEHTLRIGSSGMLRAHATVVGVWNGEITLSKGMTFSAEMRLHDRGVGTATLTAKQKAINHKIVYVHGRSSRTIRICFLPVSLGSFLRSILVESADMTTFEHIISRAVDFVAQSGTHVPIYVADAEMDAEGLRMSGLIKPHGEKTGIFSANSVQKCSFAPLSTDFANVEPLPDCVDVDIPPTPQRDIGVTMHRLIVLLSRHLYLVVCNKSNTVSKEFIEHISLFMYHPLTDRLVSNLIGESQLFVMMYEAIQLILHPSVKPWDAAALSRLVMRNMLLRPEVAEVAPESIIWDTLHAVVAAAHRCGANYRSEIIRNITTFVESRKSVPPFVYTQLFGVLLSWVDRRVSSFEGVKESRKDVAAGVDLVLTVRGALQQRIRNIPLQPLQCLMDISTSLREGKTLPKVVDECERASDESSTGVMAECTFGEYVKGELLVGKIMSSCAAGTEGRYYYEVSLPDRLTSPFVVGWGTRAHCDLPSQHVGSDCASFAYNGVDVATKDRKEEYKAPQEVTPGCVIGCLLDMHEKAVAWSVNGSLGPFIAIPIIFGAGGLMAFMSTGTCSGMKIRLRAEEFEYAPDGYTDVSGRRTRILIQNYNAAERSSLPVQPLAFYAQLTSFISDAEDDPTRKGKMSASAPGGLLDTSLNTLEQHLPRYPLISGIPAGDLNCYSYVISVLESCMATASRFVDLDGETVSEGLSTAFLYLKPLVRHSFRKRLLVNIPPTEKVTNPNTIFIRVSELYSTLPRAGDVALQHTVLSQLHKQIGAYTLTQWSQSPLFKVNLYISGTWHAPVDMGGPYRQLWTFLADEITRHPDKCYPHSDFHRNPLFRFTNNSQRVSLVPDSYANSNYELTLFHFFGKIMGHTARAKLPLDIDFSPFLWKYLVDDPLTVRDYYNYVDSVVEKSMEDDAFLFSDMVGEIIPHFSDDSMWSEEDEVGEAVIAQNRRRIAEKCLVHSMDQQLGALRSGLWSILPRRVVRCLSWHDLETMVCGDSCPSLQDLKTNIKCQLQEPRERHFWQIVKELTGEQKAALLCFATGQKRLPLVKSITVTENNESLDHLPRAQSCSSLITVPMYTSYDVFKVKLLLALEHQMEMELA